MDIREYLTSKGKIWKEIHRPSGLEAIMDCPFCDDHEGKFAISLENGAFKCLHLNNCGARGSWWDFQKRLGDKPSRLSTDKYLVPVEKIKYTPLQKIDRLELSGKALEYMLGRGFKREILEKFRIRQTPDGKAIIYPFIKNKKTVNVKYRAISEKKFWSEPNKEPTFFNYDAVGDTEILYITEGQDDCIALAHYGIDGVSVPNGTGDTRWIEHEWDFLEKFKTIIFLFDNDKAGHDSVLQIATRLGKWRCFKVVLPYKDVNECLQKNVSVEEFIKVIMHPVEFDDRIKKAIDYKEDILALEKDKKRLYGVPIDFPGLNEFLRGWRSEEVTVWTGRNSSGKTTILNLILLDLIERGEPCLMASLEMSPRHYIRWGIIQYSKKENITEHDITTVLNKIGHKWFIFNVRKNIDSDVLFDSFEYVARKYGVKHFFIDSLMKISFPLKNELSEQKEFIRRLTDFAHEYQCHCHLVAHPRKGFKDSDQPDKVDVSGAGAITDGADNVIMVYRYTPEQKEKALRDSTKIPDALVAVKKNREWGTEGIAKLSFDEKIKRYNLFYEVSY